MSVTDETLDTLISELSSSFEVAETSKVLATQALGSSSLEEHNVQQYILDKSKAIIDAGVNAVQDMTPYIVQGQDAREIDALSKLVAATAQAIDTLNKKTLIDKKADRDEQLEKIKIQARRELTELQQKNNKNVTNNNIVIASREDIMKKLYGNDSEVLEIEDK